MKHTKIKTLWIIPQNYLNRKIFQKNDAFPNPPLKHNILNRLFQQLLEIILGNEKKRVPEEYF